MKILMIALITMLSPLYISMASQEPADLTPSEFNEIRLHMVGLKVRGLNEGTFNKVAWSIYKSSKKHNVDHRIMTSIIMTESSFNQNAISSTGDVSIVQINYEIWSKEARRLGFELSKSRLKKDSNYAIDRMGVILSYLQKRYSQKDSHWFARYHSKTKSLKMQYSMRVQKNMKVAMNNEF